ncbi:MAG: peptide deformylase [Microgenomates group bacterium]
MIQKVLKSTDPKLRTVSKKVSKIDKKVLQIVQNLKDTLKVQKDPEGVGLAAPQIGKNLRVFIADYKKFKKVVINPEIVAIDKKFPKEKAGKNEILEGCLSVPNYYGPLKRAKSVTVKYLNEKAEEVTEKFENFDAQIILHEIDHLNGILFIDHIFEQKKKLYKLTNGEWEDVELV